MQNVYYHVSLITDEEYQVLPVEDKIPRHIKAPYNEKLQYALLSMSMGLDKKSQYLKEKQKALRCFLEVIRHTCNDQESRRLLHKLCAKPSRKLPDTAIPVHVWSNPVTFKYFLNLLNYQKAKGLWPRLLHEASAKIGSWSDSENFESVRVDMALDTRGYNKS